MQQIISLEKPQIILILSPLEDFHTKAVQQVLINKGHRVVIFDAAKFPEKISITFEYNNNISSCFLRDINLNLNLKDVDIVWQRRPYFSTPPSIVVKEDRTFCQSELNVTISSMYKYLDNAFWVNSRYARSSADLKPYQLKKANEASFNIPKTIITNEPSEIRKFITEHPKVIFKPLTPFTWKEKGKKFATYTSVVSLELNQLPKDELLRTTPGIFQEFIEKQYEVRVQFFGETYFAVKIDASKIKHGDIDWRFDQSSLNSFEHIKIPDSMFKNCQKLMHELGIVVGAFDFIVTVNNDWIYLEVNEAGQFLFLEEWCPDLPILDAFCSFLVSKKADFKYIQQENCSFLTEYNKEFNFA
jgi:hypothetical protein